MGEIYGIDQVLVLDREGVTIYSGNAMDAVEWICRNPVPPSQVYVKETKVTWSVDEFLTEWDNE